MPTLRADPPLSPGRHGVAAAVLALLLATLLATPATAGKMTRESFESEGRQRTFYLAVPKDLKPDGEPVPLLLVFHGSGRDGASLVSRWNRLGEKQDFIVAGPDATVADYWQGGDDGPVMLRDLVDLLAERYPVDHRRVYLFGHSGGAKFTLLMALLESRYFAAAALHAGTLPDGSESWLPGKATRKIPLYITVGTEDRFFPLPAVRATRDALTEAGLPVELVEIPHHDHWYYDSAGRINRAAWEFLSAHALEEDPVYEPQVFE
jgi:poly(3-hydroxybutyrate) depolymerase